MTLPTFLGIGVQRGGTTWLHALLETHPDIYVPSRRKEIRFFDAHFEKGIDWYESFFGAPEDGEKYRAVGEISPQYIYCDECPKRIFDILPAVHMMIMLRHPVDRAYSHYGFVRQRQNFRGSFEDFLATRPKALEYGFYGRYVNRYLRYFSKDQILALVSEEAFADVMGTCKRLADFLDVRLDGFRTETVGGKVNPSTIPKARSLASFGVTMGRRLRRWQLEPVVDLGRRIGVQRMFRGNPVPRIDDAVRRELSRSYAEEFDELEQLLDIDLSRWKE